MYSINFLISALEWLHSKFTAAADVQKTKAELHEKYIQETTLLKQYALSEERRARNFAKKIGEFLE